MATYFASQSFLAHGNPLDRITLPNAAASLEGGAAVFVIGTALTGERVFTVVDYDSSRHGEYLGTKKPHIIIKCAVACNVNNAVIKDESGATLFTFSADNSVTPAYLVLRLTADGAWELA